MHLDAPQLELSGTTLNAAGSLGFVPRKGDTPPGLAAFTTNPISLQPRRPSHGERMLAFPGGVLLHTGLPNPGLRRCIQDYGMAWAHAEMPIILNLLIDSPADLRKVVPNIEALDNLAALELNIPADASPQLAADLCAAALGKLPVLAQLTLPRAEELAGACLRAGASAVSLGAPRGSLLGPDGKVVNGRLYGPAIYPQALAATQALTRAGVPVIAAGGIESEAQAAACLAAGAMAVQWDVALWK
ncbi:MAG TPA: hypothetical protein PLC52_10645 [Anaerolineales bacterium]|nr:hypothetical protein [Anaerolineales bacterium]HRQ93306.1 hypothetical protein [Anaerolineales bacterium]